MEDGCTAVRAALRSADGGGNLGDSRAVLCLTARQFACRRIKAQLKAELARINAAGGFVKTIMGTHASTVIYRCHEPLVTRASRSLPPNRGASPPPRSPPPRGFQRTMDVGVESHRRVECPRCIPAPSKYVRDGPLSSIPDGP